MSIHEPQDREKNSVQVCGHRYEQLVHLALVGSGVRVRGRFCPWLSVGVGLGMVMPQYLDSGKVGRTALLNDGPSDAPGPTKSSVAMHLLSFEVSIYNVA